MTYFSNSFFSMIFNAPMLMAFVLTIAISSVAHAQEVKMPSTLDEVLEDNLEKNIESNVIEDSGSGSILDMPAVTTNDDDVAEEASFPILRLTQDKSEMVTLDQEAASVIVGNPNHVSVLLDTPTTLVVVPRAAGASHFTVMGKDGSILMQRHVIVGAPKEKYVRIRRSCNAASGAGCQEMSTYFCPDTCHEVQANTAGNTRRR